MTITSPRESNVDVLVIGAGPAGTPLYMTRRHDTDINNHLCVFLITQGVMCANALARYGINVRIVDQKCVIFRAVCFQLIDVRCDTHLCPL